MTTTNNNKVTEPIWFTNLSAQERHKPLSSNISTTVCIIGAGITGLTAAYLLLKKGIKVVILEYKSIGDGETSKTSAHLSNALDDRYFNLEKTHGQVKASLAAKSHAEAINLIEKISATENIDCEFKRVNGYLFSNQAHDPILAKEYAATKRCGFQDVTYDEPKFPPSVHIGKCLTFPNQAQFQPMKYLLGLEKAIIQLGGQFYENTMVTDIFEGDPLQIKTNTGFYVIAQQVIAVTNAPFQTNLAMHSKLEPNRSYVIGALIPKDSIPNALYWDTEDPYHYVRVQTYNNDYDNLIIGGEDHRVGETPKNSPFLNLYTWAKEHFPHLQTLNFQWSGQILEPVDYLAYIGQHPKLKNAFLYSGDSGNGLTHGTIAASIMTDLILKKENPYTELYKVKRNPLVAWQAFLKTNLQAMKAYLAYFSIKHFRSIENLKLGEGAIIQCGFKKLAVYKNDAGTLEICSGICSHLKGVLAWNPIEKSWDCSAHGSRFDTQGQVLNGPAKTPLTCLHNETHFTNQKEKHDD